MSIQLCQLEQRRITGSFRYGHAANFNVSPGFMNPNGTRRYPATALVCNFSKPSLKKPSLLKHDEVVTLFHGKWKNCFYLTKTGAKASLLSSRTRSWYPRPRVQNDLRPVPRYQCGTRLRRSSLTDARELVRCHPLEQHLEPH